MIAAVKKYNDSWTLKMIPKICKTNIAVAVFISGYLDYSTSADCVFEKLSRARTSHESPLMFLSA